MFQQDRYPVALHGVAPDKALTGQARVFARSRRLFRAHGTARLSSTSALSCERLIATTLRRVIAKLVELRRLVLQVAVDDLAAIGFVAVEVEQIAKVRREIAEALDLTLRARQNVAVRPVRQIPKSEEVGEGAWVCKRARRPTGLGAFASLRGQEAVVTGKLLAIHVEADSCLYLLLNTCARGFEDQALGTGGMFCRRHR
eukprot:s5158_g6.t1